MQIDRYHHLQFPRENTPASTGSGTASADSGLEKALARLPALTPTPAAARAQSVVLKVQLPEQASDKALRLDPSVYTDSRQPVGRTSLETDASHQADDHQRALDRNAGVFTRIRLDKDGVLVASNPHPQPPVQPIASAKQPDFVALAVSAMREFSDEAERQKIQSFTFDEPPAQGPAHTFKGLQQLAARFNPFER